MEILEIIRNGDISWTQIVGPWHLFSTCFVSIYFGQLQGFPNRYNVFLHILLPVLLCLASFSFITFSCEQNFSVHLCSGIRINVLPNCLFGLWFFLLFLISHIGPLVLYLLVFAIQDVKLPSAVLISIDFSQYLSVPGFKFPIINNFLYYCFIYSNFNLELSFSILGSVSIALLPFRIILLISCTSRYPDTQISTFWNLYHLLGVWNLITFCFWPHYFQFHLFSYF